MVTRWRTGRLLITFQIWFLVIFLYTVCLKGIMEQRQKYSSSTKDDASKCNLRSLSFMNTMKTFPWNSYKLAVRSDDPEDIQRYSTSLLLKLVNFLTKPPPALINLTCHPPPLKIPSSQICSMISKPRKVGVLLQFGFDVDALEIHLHELDAVVDKFFLIESVQAHSSYMTHIRKPLVWEMVKFDDRFAKFTHKIVQFLVDDASLSHVDPENVWAREKQQEKLRWIKFLEWNNATKYFTLDDIIGFGDVDEIPSRDNVYFMKTCKLPSDPIDIGIWFPFDGINTVFMSDFRIKGHKYTFAEPTFWTVQKALEYSRVSDNVPTRMEGNSLKYLLGGMHLSRYAFPPFQITKLLTKTSARKENTLERIIEIGVLHARNKTSQAKTLLNQVPARLLNRVKSLNAFRKENIAEANLIVKLPWFLVCNKNRFPSFYDEYDSRLYSS